MERHTSSVSDLRDAHVASPNGTSPSPLAQKAHAVVDQVADKARPAVEKLGERIDRVQVQAHEAVDHLDAWETRAVNGCRGYVREHPFSTVAIAFMTGLLMSGALLSYRGRAR